MDFKWLALLSFVLVDQYAQLNSAMFNPELMKYTFIPIVKPEKHVYSLYVCDLGMCLCVYSCI